MKSITIHNIDDYVFAQLKEKARNQGLSLNRAVKKMLEQALGISLNTRESHRGDFEEFCGIWSREDAGEFARNTRDFERVDPEDWK